MSLTILSVFTDESALTVHHTGLHSAHVDAVALTNPTASALWHVSFNVPLALVSASQKVLDFTDHEPICIGILEQVRTYLLPYFEYFWIKLALLDVALEFI